MPLLNPLQNAHFDFLVITCQSVTHPLPNSPISQYERPRAVALASSACVDKTTKIITEFTCKDPFLHLKRSGVARAFLGRRASHLEDQNEEENEEFEEK